MKNIFSKIGKIIQKGVAKSCKRAYNKAVLKGWRPTAERRNKTMMTRKEQFAAAYCNAMADCKDCLEHAKSAMEGNRNSDYMFWMQQYSIAFERQQHFFIEMLNCND